MLSARQLRGRHFGEVGDAVDGRQAGTALKSGRECLAEQLRAEGLCQPGRRVQTRRPGGVSTDEDRCGLTGPKRGCRRVTIADRRHRLRRNSFGGFGTLGPGHVSWQDQRCDVTIIPCRRDCLGDVGGDFGNVDTAPQPAGDGTCDRVDIGLQWGVVALVIRRVVADHDQHRYMRASGIVQIRQSVAKSRTEVQQHRRGIP